MADIVRVRLRSGGSEIEVEASSRADVDALLERWWLPSIASTPDSSVAIAGGPRSGEDQAMPRTRARSERSIRADAGSAKEPEQSFDPNTIANEIKDHAQAALIETKIVHQTGDWYNKIAFVLWFVNQPITSGQIHKILLALHVRCDLPTISKAMKKNISKFITPKQRQAGGNTPPTYHLSARAKVDFEKWLFTNG
ncbi:hypothetical protein [Inquilinus limosus]|uniref:hypothetical protein n=1 Tax=Inquilinus limosus TaxID=171674 RepID=UPI001269F40A|nr:hypothetical protein [Inquilinus limosus]